MCLPQNEQCPAPNEQCGMSRPLMLTHIVTLIPLIIHHFCCQKLPQQRYSTQFRPVSLLKWYDRILTPKFTEKQRAKASDPQVNLNLEQKISSYIYNLNLVRNKTQESQAIIYPSQQISGLCSKFVSLVLRHYVGHMMLSKMHRLKEDDWQQWWRQGRQAQGAEDNEQKQEHTKTSTKLAAKISPKSLTHFWCHQTAYT